MGGWKKYFLLLFMVFSLLGYFVLMHEKAHLQVMALHGCSETTMGINWGTIYVDCVSFMHNDSTILLQEAGYQSLTEIVGYHVAPFYVLGLVALFAWLRRDE